MPNFKYTYKGKTGIIKADNVADADLMIREIIDIDIEEIKTKRNIITFIKRLIRRTPNA